MVDFIDLLYVVGLRQDPSADLETKQPIGRTPFMSQIVTKISKNHGFCMVLPYFSGGCLTTEVPHSCASLEPRKETPL